MVKITEDKIQDIIHMYEEGKTFTDIANSLGITSDVVSKTLKSCGFKRGKINRLSQNDKEKICNWYLEDEWDKIFEKYKFMNKQEVYRLASIMGIKKEKFFWSQEDIDILINNYGKPYSEIKLLLKNEHSEKAIRTKAIKLGLTSSQEWSEEEISILKTYYSILPKSDVLALLPRRSEDAIVCMAMKHDVKSYQYLNEKYSDEEKQFIVDNYKYMTDEELANALNKPLSGVQEQRRKLGIYYLNKDYSGYVNIAKFLRGHIQEWKNYTMESCNFQCVLTGSHDFAIHHLYGFNLILKETFEVLDKENVLKGYNIEDYSKDELEYMLNKFLVIHSKYPLGVCVRKDIHDLFHKIYGAGGNTQIQWEQFVQDYQSNKYDTELAA